MYRSLLYCHCKIFNFTIILLRIRCYNYWETQSFHKKLELLQSFLRKFQNPLFHHSFFLIWSSRTKYLRLSDFPSRYNYNSLIRIPYYYFLYYITIDDYCETSALPLLSAPAISLHSFYYTKWGDALLIVHLHCKLISSFDYSFYIFIPDLFLIWLSHSSLQFCNSLPVHFRWPHRSCVSSLFQYKNEQHQISHKYFHYAFFCVKVYLYPCFCNNVLYFL